MHYAAHMGDLRLITLLKAKGASTDIPNANGSTPIDVATLHYKEKPILEEIRSALEFMNFSFKSSTVSSKSSTAK